MRRLLCTATLVVTLVCSCSAQQPKRTTWCGSRCPELASEWQAVLDHAANHCEADREELTFVSKSSSNDTLQRLASVLLEEWDLKADDPLRATPVLVFEPAREDTSFCPKDVEVSGGAVVLDLVVDAKGCVRETRVSRGSSLCPALDDYARSIAETLMFRPARNSEGYQEASIVWVLRPEVYPTGLDTSGA